MLLKLNSGQNLDSLDTVDPQLLPSSTFKIKGSFGWFLWRITPCRLFNVKSCSCIYIKNK